MGAMLFDQECSCNHVNPVHGVLADDFEIIYMSADVIKAVVSSRRRIQTSRSKRDGQKPTDLRKLLRSVWKRSALVVRPYKALTMIAMLPARLPNLLPTRE